MTVSARVNSLASLPAFQSCSEATLQRLKDEAALFAYQAMA